MQPDASWTPQFHQAREAGRIELAQVESRTPKVTIDVEPRAPGVQVQFDGVSLDLVFLGVARPVNPGKHRVVAFAPGYATTDQSFELKEDDAKKPHREVLKLVKDASGGGAVVVPPDTGGGNNNTGNQGNGTPPPPPTTVITPPQKMDALSAIYLGADLGYMIPFGKLPTLLGGTIAMDEVAGGGASLGLQGGLRLRSFLIGVNYEGGFISRDTTTARTHYFGVQGSLSTKPEGVGFYAELGIGARLMTVSSDVSNLGVEYEGYDVRGGLGLSIRIAKGFRIIPKSTLSIGSFESTGNNGITRNETHGFLGLLAIGGQFDIVALSSPKPVITQAPPPTTPSGTSQPAQAPPAP
jgi:hypothetical protein